MKISELTFGKAVDEGYVVWGLKKKNDTTAYYNYKDLEKCEYITISHNYIFRTFRVTTKEITLDWILSKFEKEHAYINLSKYLKREFNNSFNIYCTSYGIGIDVFLSKKDDAIEAVANKLDSLNIEYRNEFSDAKWIYRFIISKSKTNMEFIKKL